MWVVDVSATNTFSAGKPRLLFDGAFLGMTTGGHNYDLTPDGQRFLMLTQGERESRLDVIVNWTEELKTRDP